MENRRTFLKKGLSMLGVVAAAFSKTKIAEPKAIEDKPEETEIYLPLEELRGWEWCCPVRPANGIEIYSPDMNGNVPISSKPIFIYNYTSGTTDNGWRAIETTA